jgi:hypothetical protein
VTKNPFEVTRSTTGAKERFRAKRRAVRKEISDFQEDIGLEEVLEEVLKRIE